MLPGELRDPAAPVPDVRDHGLVAKGDRRSIQTVMTERVEVLREAAGLAEATERLAAIDQRSGSMPQTSAWDTTNIHTVATVLTLAATMREETRGSHWREDFPERDDERMAGHIDAVLTDGVPVLTFHPAPSTDPSTQEIA